MRSVKLGRVRAEVRFLPRRRRRAARLSCTRVAAQQEMISAAQVRQFLHAYKRELIYFTRLEKDLKSVASYFPNIGTATVDFVCNLKIIYIVIESN